MIKYEMVNKSITNISKEGKQMIEHSYGPKDLFQLKSGPKIGYFELEQPNICLELQFQTQKKTK